jgi:hypothetical protein
MLSNQKPLDNNSLSLMNLAMLLETKTEDNYAKKELYKMKSDQLITKSISYNRKTNNNFILLGDAMYSSQFYYSNNDQSSKQYAIKNGLAIFNVTECETVLKQYYNIYDPNYIVFSTSRIDAAMNLDNITTYMFSAYDFNNQTKLDIDICKNLTLQIEMPFNNFGLNLTVYKDFKEQGLDIFDPNDPYFNNRCTSYVETLINADTTINWRRMNLYQSQGPMCLGANCTYNGINDIDYISCSCAGVLTETQFINNLRTTSLGTVTNFNMGIVACSNLISMVIII